MKHKPKFTHGGARKGAGRKPDSERLAAARRELWRLRRIATRARRLLNLADFSQADGVTKRQVEYLEKELREAGR